MTRFLVLLSILLLSCISSFADSIGFRLPEFHGVVRPRWEMDTQSGESRFEVRWARLTMEGAVAPKLGYFLQIDLCDQGSIKFKDAYVKVLPTTNLQIVAGQMIMPFSADPFIAPQNFLFANRSFMTKYMNSYRKVGLKVVYDVAHDIPLTIEAGIYNTGSITNHNTWSKDYAGAGRATYLLGDFKLNVGAMTLKPDMTRMNLLDAGVIFTHTDFRMAAQYTRQHYCGAGLDDTQAWCLWGDYGRDAKIGMFNRWSVQARFDGMTRDWSGVDGEAFNPARNRLTIGGSLTYRYKKVYADLLCNYENYFYHKDFTTNSGQGNRIVTEIAVRF